MLKSIARYLKSQDTLILWVVSIGSHAAIWLLFFLLFPDWWIGLGILFTVFTLTIAGEAYEEVANNKASILFLSAFTSVVIGTTVAAVSLLVAVLS